MPDKLRWIVLVTLIATATSPSLAAEEPYCARTAQLAFGACHYEALDDLYAARALCTNVQDPAERTACVYDARTTWSEDWQTCADVREARLDVCEELGGGRYDPSFDPADFVHPDAIAVQNPWRSLAAGHTAVLRAEAGEELIVVHVTDRVKQVAGVPCRVVVDVELEVGEDEGAVDYEALEVTDDWYAYHVSGDVWYCGELSRNFEEGELVDIDGSFQAGRDGAKPGILIRFVPIVGELYRQEFALGEAEDLAQVLDTAASPDEEVEAYRCDGGCLKTRDFSPLEPETEENKYYLPGIGFVLALSFEYGVQTEDREELVCTGNSLAVLTAEACGIADPDALLETLCELAPGAFCAD